jgi:hypothetical protein
MPIELNGKRHAGGVFVAVFGRPQFLTHTRGVLIQSASARAPVRIDALVAVRIDVVHVEL